MCLSCLWGFVSHSWTCLHDSQLQIVCGCWRWKMEKYINWKHACRQSVVIQPFIYCVCNPVIERRRNPMSTCTLLAVFMNALVRSKPVWEKSLSSSHLAEYRGIPSLKNSKIDVWEKEATSLPLLLRAIARKPCATYFEIDLCFLSLVPPNPAYEYSMWKSSMHSEAGRSWSK